MGLGEALDALDEQRELDQVIPYTLTPAAVSILDGLAFERQAGRAALVFGMLEALTSSLSCGTIESVRIDLRQSDGANHRIDEVKHEHSNRTQEQPP
jgi:hypothetical protein